MASIINLNSAAAASPKQLLAFTVTLTCTRFCYLRLPPQNNVAYLHLAVLIPSRVQRKIYHQDQDRPAIRILFLSFLNTVFPHPISPQGAEISTTFYNHNHHHLHRHRLIYIIIISTIADRYSGGVASVRHLRGMASATAPCPPAASLSSSQSYHPSPAPSSSPTSSTSSQSLRKRKRDEYLADPIPLVISPHPSSIENNVPASSTMYPFQIFTSIWGTLKGLAGIVTPPSSEGAEVEAPELPSKRVCVDRSSDEGRFSFVSYYK